MLRMHIFSPLLMLSGITAEPALAGITRLCWRADKLADIKCDRPRRAAQNSRRCGIAQRTREHNGVAARLRRRRTTAHSHPQLRGGTPSARASVSEGGGNVGESLVRTRPEKQPATGPIEIPFSE